MAQQATAARKQLVVATAKAPDTEAQKRFKTSLLSEYSRGSKNKALELKLNDKSKAVIHKLVDYYGMPWLSEQLEMAPLTIYRVLAGFQESARPSTRARLKEFLVDYDG
jgi:hypothetical protein